VGSWEQQLLHRNKGYAFYVMAAAKRANPRPAPAAATQAREVAEVRAMATHTKAVQMTPSPQTVHPGKSKNQNKLLLGQITQW
jgi:hypothetical protein